MPSQSSRQRKLLAENIEKKGVAFMPCNHCLKDERPCVVSRNSRKCSNCVRHGFLDCDAKEITAADFDRLALEKERLRSEIRAERKRLQAAALEQQRALAKILRLERLQETTEEREGELLRRGIHNVEELEKLEEAERVVASLVDGVGASPELAIGDFPSSPSWLRDLGSWDSADGIVGPDAGTS
jgi:predicted ribosome quality control (RQC) complex YloA/Tae2 family protein